MIIGSNLHLPDAPKRSGSPDGVVPQSFEFVLTHPSRKEPIERVWNGEAKWFWQFKQTD